MVRRVPMMVGPLAGGWMVTRYGWVRGVQYALRGCVGLGTLTALLQWFIAEPQTASKLDRNTSFFTVVRSFSPTLRELLVSDILIRFCERIPYAFVILWAMNYGGVTAQQFGYLVAIEMITAMVCYIPVAHLADKHGRTPFVFATFIFFTLFPVSLLWAKSFGSLAVAFAIRGLKEFGEAARKAMNHRRSPAGSTRPNLRRLLSDPRFSGHHRLLSRRVAALVRRPTLPARHSAGPSERFGSGGFSRPKEQRVRFPFDGDTASGNGPFTCGHHPLCRESNAVLACQRDQGSRSNRNN